MGYRGPTSAALLVESRQNRLLNQRSPKIRSLIFLHQAQGNVAVDEEVDVMMFEGQI